MLLICQRLILACTIWCLWEISRCTPALAFGTVLCSPPIHGVVYQRPCPRLNCMSSYSTRVMTLSLTCFSVNLILSACFMTVRHCLDMCHSCTEFLLELSCPPGMEMDEYEYNTVLTLLDIVTYTRPGLCATIYPVEISMYNPIH